MIKITAKLKQQNLINGTLEKHPSIHPLAALFHTLTKNDEAQLLNSESGQKTLNYSRSDQRHHVKSLVLECLVATWIHASHFRVFSANVT